MCGRKIVKTHARKNVRRDVYVPLPCIYIHHKPLPVKMHATLGGSRSDPPTQQHAWTQPSIWLQPHPALITIKPWLLVGLVSKNVWYSNQPKTSRISKVDSTIHPGFGETVHLYIQRHSNISPLTSLLWQKLHFRTHLVRKIRFL